jgi:hypothetical protein
MRYEDVEPIIIYSVLAGRLKLRWLPPYVRFIDANLTAAKLQRVKVIIYSTVAKAIQTHS